MTVRELLRNQFYSSNIITEEIMLGSVFEEDTTVWKSPKKKKKKHFPFTQCNEKPPWILKQD